jgi:hypothetical protein
MPDVFRHPAVRLAFLEIRGCQVLACVRMLLIELQSLVGPLDRVVVAVLVQ